MPGIDRWLRESVGDLIRTNRVRVWCATDGQGALAGFYGLAMHSVSAEAVPALARRKERHPIPVIYLTVLAVDQRHQGRGVGSVLMADAIARAISLSEEIGTAAIVLDVLKDASFNRRRAFYSALGFAEVGSDDPARLFLSIKDARAEWEAREH